MKLLAKELESITQKELAARIGVSPQMVNDMLHRNRSLNQKMLDYLGIERVVIYRRRSGQ